MPKYPSGKPRQYESDVHVVSVARGAGEADGRPKAVHAKISVNHPMRWNGWWIYQNSYDAAQEAYTVLEAVRDPFLPMAALAGSLLLWGAAMLAMKVKVKVKAKVKESSPSPSVASVVRFAAATAVVMLPLWIVGRAVLAKELVPALQSPLLVPHVGAYLVS